MSAHGGALPKMITPFRLGLGGRLGSGRQWWSWVSVEDVAGAIHHVLTHDSLQGPVNTVAPNPVTNAEFTSTLASVLRRPAIFPMPAFAVRLVFGEMGEELFLSSQRVEPAKLAASGYQFQHPGLEKCAARDLAALTGSLCVLSKETGTIIYFIDTFISATFWIASAFTFASSPKPVIQNTSGSRRNQVIWRLA